MDYGGYEEDNFNYMRFLEKGNPAASEIIYVERRCGFVDWMCEVIGGYAFSPVSFYLSMYSNRRICLDLAKFLMRLASFVLFH